MRNLDSIEAQVAHLGKVVEDLLEMSRLDDDATEFKFARVDLNGIVRDAVATQEYLAHSQNHTLTLELDGDIRPIAADALRLKKLSKT